MLKRFTQLNPSVLLRAAAIAAAVAFVYAPVFHGQWLWDDDVEVTENLALRTWSGLWRIWYLPNSPDFFPLKTSLQWAQWHLWHDQVLGYHLTNVGLHLLGACLLWHLLGKLGVKFAWLGGLIFAVHPIAVESVAWISELKNVMSLPLLLIAAIFFLRERLFASLLFFVAAMLCKSSVVMFPVALLLYAWWKRGRVGWPEVRASLPFFAVSCSLGLVTLWFQAHRAIAGEVILTGGALPRVAAAGMTAMFYLWKCVLPVGMMPIYPRWQVTPPSLWQFWPWGVLIVGVLLWVKRGAGRVRLRAGGATARRALLLDSEAARVWVVGLGFFLINLVPVLGFVPMSFLRLSWVSDHFAYLPLVGLVGLAAAGLGWVRRPMAWALVFAVIAALMLESRSYAARFVDSETLWTYNLERNPAAPAANNNLGNALLRRGRISEAATQYEEALRLQPDFAEVHNNLANIDSQNGRAREALFHYYEALRLNPSYSQARNGLGNLLAQMGQTGPAIEQFKLALEESPWNVGAHNNYANTLMSLGQYAEAEAHLREALRIEPGFADAHSNLGNVFLHTGRMDQAVAAYRQALKLNPGFPEANNNLGNALVMKGRVQEGIACFERAIQLRPGYAEAHFNLGLVDAGLGRRDEAIAQYELALRYRPDFPRAREELDKLQAGVR